MLVQQACMARALTSIWGADQHAVPASTQDAKAWRPWLSWPYFGSLPLAE